VRGFWTRSSDDTLSTMPDELAQIDWASKRVS